MGAGGLTFVENNISSDLRKRNYSARVIDLAMEMMTFVGGLTIKYIKKIKLKIGIHHGHCMMGIIGYHKPQFSLIGDTINFCSRHCSTGKAGNIMVSREAWERAEIWDVSFKIVPTEMKGKGLVDVYHIHEFAISLRDRFLAAMENIDYLYHENLTTFDEREINVLKSLANMLYNTDVDTRQGRKMDERKAISWGKSYMKSGTKLWHDMADDISMASMNKGFKWYDHQESFDVSFCLGTPTGAHRSFGNQFAKKELLGTLTETTTPCNIERIIVTSKLGKDRSSDRRSDIGLENTQGWKNYEQSLRSNDSKQGSSSPSQKASQQSIDMVSQKTP
jgi:hypothetical protein